MTQSKISPVQNEQFFIFTRGGNDAATTLIKFQSIHRRVDIYDIGPTTEINGSTYDSSTCPVTSSRGAC
jgi:hypothetical protein